MNEQGRKNTAGEASAREAAHLALGREGESFAAAYLLQKGLRIRHRNWRPAGKRSFLELDIVAQERDCLVFVEVKTRARSAGESEKAGPDRPIPVYASFTQAKRRKLERAAQAYLAESRLWDFPCRFDLICVERQADGRFFLEYFADVIEFGHTLGRGYAAWQPW